MLKVLIPREWDPNEQRVASSPDVIRRLRSRKLSCRVEKGAGVASGFSDADFADAGAELVNPSDPAIWGESDVVLSVGPINDQARPSSPARC